MRRVRVRASVQVKRVRASARVTERVASVDLKWSVLWTLFWPGMGFNGKLLVGGEEKKYVCTSVCKSVSSYTGPKL